MNALQKTGSALFNSVQSLQGWLVRLKMVTNLVILGMNLWMNCSHEDLVLREHGRLETGCWNWELEMGDPTFRRMIWQSTGDIYQAR